MSSQVVYVFDKEQCKLQLYPLPPMVSDRGSHQCSVMQKARLVSVHLSVEVAQVVASGAYPLRSMIGAPANVGHSLLDESQYSQRRDGPYICWM